MKFYEFSTNNFSYYALIGAENESEAMVYYAGMVADIEENDGIPTEVDKEFALGKLLSACKDDIEEMDAIKEFKELTKLDKPYLILIDYALL